ncbi:MAG TPA: biotin/lipoyl-containing protein, partial [Streptosporangiaceae bacterium]|nr:biotin/lipoyl-containing protein [Streptosporangiaceae bacterium]
MPDFLLPDLGEGLDEAEVIAWRVDVGDRVTVDQIVVEVETAKAAVEVPVPFAGIVARLHAAPGTVISVGQPLITVAAGEPASGFREPGVVTADAVAAGSSPTADSEPGPERSGNVLVGYGTSAAPRRSRRAAGRTAHRAAAAPRSGSAAPGPGPAAAR